MSRELSEGEQQAGDNAHRVGSPVDRHLRRLERGNVDAELILAVRLPWSSDHSSRDLCLFRDAQGQYRLEIRPSAEGRSKVVFLPKELVINAATVDEVMLLVRGLEGVHVETMLSPDEEGGGKTEMEYFLNLDTPGEEPGAKVSAYSFLRAVAMAAYSYAPVTRGADRREGAAFLMLPVNSEHRDSPSCAFVAYPQDYTALATDRDEESLDENAALFHALRTTVVALFEEDIKRGNRFGFAGTVYEQTIANRIVGGSDAKRQDTARNMLLNLRSDRAGWKTLRSVCAGMAQRMEGNPGTIRALALATEASGGPPILGLMSEQMEAAVTQKTHEFFAHHTDSRSTELAAQERRYRELEAEIKRLTDRVLALMDDEDKLNAMIAERSSSVAILRHDSQVLKRDVEVLKEQNEPLRKAVATLKEEDKQLTERARVLSQLLEDQRRRIAEFGTIHRELEVAGRSADAAIVDGLIHHSADDVSTITQLYTALQREQHTPEYFASEIEYYMRIMLQQIDRISDVDARNKVTRLIISLLATKLRSTS